MVAIGADDNGYREIIGAAEGFTESSECWREFSSWLKSRGMRGVRMFTGDKAAGMVGSIAKVFPSAACRRCTVHFYRNVLARVPKSKRPRVATMLRAVHAMESREAAEAKALEMLSELRAAKLNEAAKFVMDGYAETLAYIRFPPRALAQDPHEQRHRAPEPGKPQAHLRGRDVPRLESALMLATARVKNVAESEWGRPTLPGRDAAGRAVAPDGRPLGCRNVRKNHDGTSRSTFSRRSLSCRSRIPAP